MKERSCKLTIAFRQCYDASVSCRITGHAGQGALPGSDRGCRISDYYCAGETLVFKLISWLAGERQIFSRLLIYEYTWLKGDLRVPLAL